MIRNFTLFCKLHLFHSSDFILVQHSLNAFSIPSSSCPFCGAKGCLSLHSSYSRDMLSLKDGVPFRFSLSIPRLFCSSCSHTHALLPDLLVPYSSYSLLFILSVLRSFFLRSSTVEALCLTFRISPSTLYFWIHLFHTHKRLWLGILTDSLIAPLSFLDSLFPDCFLPSFFLMAGFSFLQNHRKTTPSVPP